MAKNINWELRKTNSQKLSKLISDISKNLVRLKTTHSKLTLDRKDLRLTFQSSCTDLKKLKSHTEQFKQSYEDKKNEWLKAFDSLDLYDYSDDIVELLDSIKNMEKQYLSKNSEVLALHSKIRENTTITNDILEDIRKHLSEKKQYQMEHEMFCLNHFEKLALLEIENSDFYKQFLAVSFYQLNLKKKVITNKSEMLFIFMKEDAKWKYMKLGSTKTYEELRKIWNTIINEPPTSTKYFNLYDISDNKIDIINQITNQR